MNEFVDFVGKIGSAAKRAAGSVATDVNVAAKEQKIKECYQALGKLYYAAQLTGKPLEGKAYAEYCREIDEHRRQIQELKNRRDVGNCEDDFVDLDRQTPAKTGE